MKIRNTVIRLHVVEGGASQFGGSGLILTRFGVAARRRVLMKHGMLPVALGPIPPLIDSRAAGVVG